jgi:hypothetical protein
LRQSKRTITTCPISVDTSSCTRSESIPTPNLVLDRERRHYSVANCIYKKVYADLCDALQNGASDEQLEVIHSGAAVSNNGPTLTAKNYAAANGLSSKIHQAEDNTQIVIKGPLGKGLDLCGSAGILISTHYVAFAAGIGVLVFFDLVAAIARKHLSVKDNALANDFKFELPLLSRMKIIQFRVSFSSWLLSIVPTTLSSIFATEAPVKDGTMTSSSSTFKAAVCHQSFGCAAHQ